MAEEKLKLVIEADSAAAVAGAKAAETAVEDLGKAGTDAGKLIEQGLDKGTIALKDVGAEIAKLRPGLGEVGKAAQEAGVAFVRLGAGGDSIRGVIKNAAAAQVALDELKKAADKARASGEKLPEGFNAGLKSMQGEIDKAVTKARTLADVQGDLKTKGDAAAKGFESMTGAAGSLEGMLGKLKDTAGPLGQGIAEIGFKMVAVGAAFNLGLDIGNKVRDAWKTWYGTEMPSLISAWEKLNGVTLKNADLLTPLPGKINAVRAAQQAHARQVELADKALKEQGIAYTTVAEAQKKVEDQLRNMVTRLLEAQKAGRDFVKELDPKSIIALADAAAKAGIDIDKLDPIMRKAVDASVAMALADDKIVGAKEKATEAIKAQTQALQDNAKAAEEAQAASDAYFAPGGTTSGLMGPTGEQLKQIDAILKKQQELEAQTRSTSAAMEAATQAAASYGKGLNDIGPDLAKAQKQIDAVAEAQVALNNQWRETGGVLQAVNWEIRHATQKTTELSGAQKQLIEDLATVSDQFGVSSTWIGHYIAQLEDDMKKGTGSMVDFKKKVEDIIQGLTQINGAGSGFMGNLSEEMLRLNKLINDFDWATKKAAGGG